MALDDPQLRQATAESELIVNCTSVGLHHGDPSPLPESFLEPYHLVCDTIYQPPRTRLLRAAASTGARIANGTSLLLHQGVLAFEIWFPGEAPIAEMRAGLAASLG